MVTDEEIRRKIFQVVASHARREADSLTLDTTFAELRMASLDIVEMLFGIEEVFDVYMPVETQQVRFATLGDVCDGVKKLIAERHA